MKFNTVLVSFALFVFLIPVSAQNIQVLETGAFHGEEVSAKSGEVWLGLYENRDGYMLMPSILSVEEVYDGIIDAPGEKSGKEIRVPGMGDPLFLIRGKGFEQARPVQTVKFTNNEIDGSFDQSFVLLKKEYRLRIVSTEKHPEGFVGNKSKLVLSDGKIEQELYFAEECSFCKWRVSWAGDLDSDGKPDFLLFVSEHYNVSNQKLFLSSMAENGKLVKEVAEFTTTGC